jgi:hypothetical protein
MYNSLKFRKQVHLPVTASLTLCYLFHHNIFNSFIKCQLNHTSACVYILSFLIILADPVISYPPALSYPQPLFPSP